MGLKCFSGQSGTGLRSESNPVDIANVIRIQDFILKYLFDKVWVLWVDMVFCMSFKLCQRSLRAFVLYPCRDITALIHCNTCTFACCKRCSLLVATYFQLAQCCIFVCRRGLTSPGLWVSTRKEEEVYNKCKLVVRSPISLGVTTDCF